jgi:hypothetical protein
MRPGRAILVALAAALVSFPVASADEPPAAAPAPKQETVVNGTAPDLIGRWLVLGWIALPGGRTTNLTSLWDVDRRDGRLVFTQRFVELPAALKTAVDGANEAGTRWQPSPADLRAIATDWDRLPPDAGVHVAQVTTEIAGRDGFDESLKTEPRTRDATWVVRQRQDNGPEGAPVIRQVFIWAALARADGGWTGNCDAATLAATPFPIPISVKGDFRAYRLSGEEPPADRGLVARLLDVLSGCRRSGS